MPGDRERYRPIDKQRQIRRPKDTERGERDRELDNERGQREI